MNKIIALLLISITQGSILFCCEKISSVLTKAINEFDVETFETCIKSAKEMKKSVDRDLEDDPIVTASPLMHAAKNR